MPFSMTDSAANEAEAWRWIGKHPGEAIVLSLDHIYDTFFGVVDVADVQQPARGRTRTCRSTRSSSSCSCRRCSRAPVSRSAASRAALTSRTALVAAPRSSR